MYNNPTKVVVEIPNTPNPKMSHTDLSMRLLNLSSKKFVKLSLHTERSHKRSNLFRKRSKLLLPEVNIDQAEVMVDQAVDLEAMVDQAVDSVASAVVEVTVDQVVDSVVSADHPEEDIKYNEI